VQSAGSEKPEVVVAGCHILLVGGCRETGISGMIRPNSATRLAGIIINIIFLPRLL
jgi:hypothetical protein